MIARTLVFSVFTFIRQTYEAHYRKVGCRFSFSARLSSVAAVPLSNAVRSLVVAALVQHALCALPVLLEATAFLLRALPAPTSAATDTAAAAADSDSLHEQTAWLAAWGPTLEAVCAFVGSRQEFTITATTSTITTTTPASTTTGSSEPIGRTHRDEYETYAQKGVPSTEVPCVRLIEATAHLVVAFLGAAQGCLARNPLAPTSLAETTSPLEKAPLWTLTVHVLPSLFEHAVYLLEPTTSDYTLADRPRFTASALRTAGSAEATSLAATCAACARAALSMLCAYAPIWATSPRAHDTCASWSCRAAVTSATWLLRESRGVAEAAMCTTVTGRVSPGLRW